MPLFLKSIDPVLDIFGNEQALRYNTDQLNNDANLLLLNDFAATASIFPSISLSFANSNLKGFRFYHELSNSSVYGDFYLQTYSKFGTSTNIWGYDEQTDSLTFFKNVSLSGLSITGNLSLNSNKIINLANGVASNDAVNLGQLNSAITGLGFSGLSTNGLLARTAANTYVSRNIAVNTGLNISNADAVAGNPTLSLSAQLQNLHNLNSLGFVSLSTAGAGSSSFVNRSLVAGSGISITNGNGASGNPTITVSNIPINTLSGYPSDSTLFLNGIGNWAVPSFPSLITISASTYHLILNNTNTSATSTDFFVQNNGTDGVSVGFNNSTNEAYLWAFNTAILKFGTANTKRAQILNNGTFDLLTNNLTTSGSVSATTGTLKGNNLAVHNSTSIAVLNALAMNSNYITGLASPINNQDAATKLYVDNSSGGAAQSILHGYNNPTYSANIGVGDHIKFDGVAFVRGSNITLDTSSAYTTSTGVASVGRITLAAGKTYKLIGSLNNATSSGSGDYNATRWYNADTGAVLGLISGAAPPNSTVNRVPGAGTIAYITTSVATRVELRITFNSLSSVNGTGDSIGTAWFTAEEV